MSRFIYLLFFIICASIVRGQQTSIEYIVNGSFENNIGDNDTDNFLMFDDGDVYNWKAGEIPIDLNDGTNNGLLEVYNCADVGELVFPTDGDYYAYVYKRTFIRNQLNTAILPGQELNLSLDYRTTECFAHTTFYVYLRSEDSFSNMTDDYLVALDDADSPGSWASMSTIIGVDESENDNCLYEFLDIRVLNEGAAIPWLKNENESIQEKTLDIGSVVTLLDNISVTGCIEESTDIISINVDESDCFDITFTSNNVSNKRWYKWDFGDGQIACGETLNTVNHIYITSGTYDVTLTMVNDNGCLEVISEVIEVCIIPDPCENVNVNASFYLEDEHVSSTYYKLTPDNYNTYDNINGQHSWRVLRSENANGPYTFMESYTTPSFTYLAQYGYIYTVLHRVVTDCGEDCYGWNKCEGGCGGGNLQTSCNYCGPIDCTVVQNTCSIITPRNLGCKKDKKGNKILDWNGVFSSTGYLVQFMPGGDCCDTYQVFTPFTVSVTSSFMTPPSGLGDCYSWRVQAICRDGSLSPWSEIECTNITLCGVGGDDPGPDPDGDTIGGFVGATQPQHGISIYPNPTHDQLTLDVGEWYGKHITLEVRNTDGQLLTSFDQNTVTDKRTVLDLGHLPAGVYWLRIHATDEVPVTKRVIIQ